MRRWAFGGLLFILGVLGVIGTVSAQDAAQWSTWLYDGEAGQAVQIAANGERLQDVALPVPAEYVPGTIRYSRALSVNNAGTRLAYRIDGRDANGAPLSTFIVYDVRQSAAIMTYNPPFAHQSDTLSVDLNPALFNQRGSAVAYAHQTFIDDGTGNNAFSMQWRIVVLDIETGQTLFELDDRTPAMQSALGGSAGTHIPIVQHYEGANLDFTLLPAGSELQAINPSFRWDVLIGRVFATSAYPNVRGDSLLPTGEVVLPVVDERVANQLAAQAFQINALHVFRPEIGGRAPFVAGENLDILNAFFIQNGERILFQSFNLIEGGNPDAILWRMAERDGTTLAFAQLAPIENQIVGTPDGFVYVLDASAPLLVEVRTRSAAVEQVGLWTAPPGFHPVPVWVGGAQLNAQTTYEAWAQLAPPVFPEIATAPTAEPDGVSPSELSTRTPIGRSGGILFINGVAIVNTTEGDRLNLRREASLSSPVIARVERGTRVTLVEGPRAGDGFVWWRVRLPTALEGWVVESAEGIDTLIPAG